MPIAARLTFGTFRRDERGAIAVIFALVLVPALTIVSLAIDYGRALKAKSTIQNAADAATYASLPRLAGGNDELIRSVRQNLDANLPQHHKGVDFELKVAKDRTSMDVKIETQINTSLIALVGIDKMDVGVTSTAKLPTTPTGQTRHQGGGGDVDMPDLSRELGRFGQGGGVTSRDLKGRDLQELQNSEEMKRAAEALEAQLKAAIGGGSGGAGIDMRELQRLMRQ